MASKIAGRGVVELSRRFDFTEVCPGYSTTVKIVVQDAEGKGQVRIGMNGKTFMTFEEMQEMNDAVFEAKNSCNHIIQMTPMMDC